MSDESRSLFFMRTFGFALFWIWLCLVAVSPSPLFGALKGLGSLPFEVWEVGARLLLLSLSLAATRLLTTSRGRWVYPVCCLVGGPVAALALSSAATPEAVTLAAFITAVVDVAMLIMWLCYFGYAKIGDIAFMLACSYALGSILYLAVVAAGETAMLVAAITSPILSGALFAYFVKNPPSLASEGLFQASPAAGRRPKLPAALRRLAIGLTLYAFVFALFSSRTAVSEYTFSSGPLVQALASIVLAAVVIAAIRLSDVSGGLYALYRSVPLVFGGGAALFLVLPAGLSLCAGFFVMFGYLLFEALSFNDFCNATKTNDGSLLRSMLIVRIAGSLGIFLGWVLGAQRRAGSRSIEPSDNRSVLCCRHRCRVARLHGQGHGDARHHRRHASPSGGRRGASRQDAAHSAVRHRARPLETRGRGARVPAARPHHAVHCRKTVHRRVHRPLPRSQDIPENRDPGSHGAYRPLRAVLL